MASVRSWEVDPVVEPVEGEKGQTIHVVRDDLLLGGSKTRFLSKLVQADDSEELVFGGPFCGGAPVALAAVGRQLGRRVTIFYAARKTPHRRQEQVASLGGRIEWVPAGYMSNVQAKARAYAEGVGARFLPLGFDVPEAEGPFVDAMRLVRAMTGRVPEVWCATGSGMLARCLGRAFPEAQVWAVAVGLASRWQKQGFPRNVTPLYSRYHFDQSCHTRPPFPSCPNYDAKAWEVASKRAADGALFWNVLGP